MLVALPMLSIVVVAWSWIRFEDNLDCVEGI
jgi:hypothetical protein